MLNNTQQKRCVMPTDYEFSLFCMLSYEESDVSIRAKKFTGDWEYIRSSSKVTDTGTKCLVFFNKQTKQLVFVVRGSHVVENWVTNFWELYPGDRPTCYAEVRNFFIAIQKLFPGYDIFFTGHSLGAHLAELLACEFLKPAVTFESPGCLETAREMGFNYAGAQVVSYLSAPNIVNTLHSHVGEMRRIYIPHTEDHASSRIESGSFLIDGAKKIISSPNLVWLSLHLGLHIIKKTIDIKYLKRIHSMVRIADGFDQAAGEPFLQRKVYKWPSHTDYLSFFHEGRHAPNWLLDSNYDINRNIEKSFEDLSNYELGHFIVPGSYRSLNKQNQKQYQERALEEQAVFFDSQFLALKLGVFFEKMLAGEKVIFDPVKSKLQGAKNVLENNVSKINNGRKTMKKEQALKVVAGAGIGALGGAVSVGAAGAVAGTMSHIAAIAGGSAAATALAAEGGVVAAGAAGGGLISSAGCGALAAVCTPMGFAVIGGAAITAGAVAVHKVIAEANAENNQLKEDRRRLYEELGEKNAELQERVARVEEQQQAPAAVQANQAEQAQGNNRPNTPNEYHYCINEFSKGEVDYWDNRLPEARVHFVASRRYCEFFKRKARDDDNFRRCHQDKLANCEGLIGDLNQGGQYYDAMRPQQ